MLLIAGLCCIPFKDFILVAVKLLKMSFSCRILFFKHFPDESKPHRRGMALCTPWIFTEVPPLGRWKPVTQQCDPSCQGHSCPALLPPWPLALAASRARTSVDSPAHSRAPALGPSPGRSFLAALRRWFRLPWALLGLSSARPPASLLGLASLPGGLQIVSWEAGVSLRTASCRPQDPVSERCFVFFPHFSHCLPQERSPDRSLPPDQEQDSSHLFLI